MMNEEPYKARAVVLRPAQPRDYSFALALYLDGTKHLLAKLGRWSDARVVARFRLSFKREEARIICIDGEDIGWMQVSETAARFHIRQLHLISRVRGQGIGTRLITQVLERATLVDKPVALNVIKGNPAVALYERLGFRIVGRDEDKFHMLWEPEKTKGE